MARLTGAELRLMHVVDQLTYVTGYESYGLDGGDRELVRYAPYRMQTPW
jgi:hypothetical protein